MGMEMHAVAAELNVKLYDPLNGHIFHPTILDVKKEGISHHQCSSLSRAREQGADKENKSSDTQFTPHVFPLLSHMT
jgi:hypothetical protein